MATKIFVNLPVKDLKKSIAFTRFGFKFNPQFTDETATCTMVGEDIFVMLLIEAKFKTFTFTPKAIRDARKATEVLVNCETQDEVDALWEKLSEGGERGQCGWLKDKYGVSWQIIPLL